MHVASPEGGREAVGKCVLTLSLVFLGSLSELLIWRSLQITEALSSVRSGEEYANLKMQNVTARFCFPPFEKANSHRSQLQTGKLHPLNRRQGCGAGTPDSGVSFCSHAVPLYTVWDVDVRALLFSAP